MRIRILLLSMLLSVATAAPAQVNIGINFSLFPELVRVPDYPVYYAPRQNANYFFYDGMYWVYRNDDWYSSDWYNGPWWRTAPEYVPEYVLRVPVRYYRQPPSYFRGWQGNAPPRWGEHWGRDWEQRRGGWDKWDRRAAPRPAPLPTYQRQYTGNRYPRVEEQHTLRDQKYRYEPKDSLVREHVRPQMQGASTRDRQPEPRRDSAKDERDQRPAPTGRPSQKSEQPVQRQQPEPRKDSVREGRERDQRPDTSNRPAQKSEPAAQPPRPPAAERQQDQRGDDRQNTREREQRPERAVQQPRPQGAPEREQPAQQPPRPQPQAAPPAEANRGREKGPEREHEKREERGK